VVVASRHIDGIAGGLFSGHEVGLQEGTQTATLAHRPLMDAVVVANHSSTIDV